MPYIRYYTYDTIHTIHIRYYTYDTIHTILAGAVYKANDTVRVKGYVRQQAGAALAAPPAGTPCRLRVRWTRGEAQSETTFSLDEAWVERATGGVEVAPGGDGAAVPPSAPVGAFAASLHIPARVDYTTHAISLQCLLADVSMPPGVA